MIVGGVDTYYDYEEHQWKFRRLGGGPIHGLPVCPEPRRAPETGTNASRPAIQPQTRMGHVPGDPREG